MLSNPLKVKTAKSQEVMSASSSPPPSATLRIMATGADAANRKATKALNNSVITNLSVVFVSGLSVVIITSI